MTAYQKVVRALNKRKNMTLPELEKATGVNPNTLRRELANFCVGTDRVCRITGQARQAYVNEVYGLAI